MNRRAEELGYIEARLTMLTAEEGGRPRAIRTGYCPNWWFPGETDREFASACVEIVDEDELRPGATGTVRIYPIAPDLWIYVVPGSDLDMTEGPHFRVGQALVTRVVPSTVPIGQS